MPSLCDAINLRALASDITHVINEENFCQFFNINSNTNTNANNTNANTIIDASDASKSMSPRPPSLSPGEIIQSNNPDTLSSSGSRSKLKTTTECKSQPQPQPQPQSLLVLEDIDDSSPKKDRTSAIKGMKSETSSSSSSSSSSKIHSTSSAGNPSGTSSTLYSGGRFVDIIQWMSNSRLVEQVLFGLESG